MELPALLAELERSGAGPAETEVALAYLVREAVRLDEDELRGALRRALLLLAAGGDPYRELEPDGRAVLAVADDLDEAARRRALVRALGELREHAPPRGSVATALDRLGADPALAWRRLAAALLADELAGEPE